MTISQISEPAPDSLDLQFPLGVKVRSDGLFFWMSGATAIPLYHMHPHDIVECMVPDDIEQQTRRVLDTFDDILRFNDMTWRNVVKFSQFLTDMRDFDAVQAIIKEYFEGTNWAPASAAVGINHLSGSGCRLEIDVVAARSI